MNFNLLFFYFQQLFLWLTIDFNIRLRCLDSGVNLPTASQLIFKVTDLKSVSVRALKQLHSQYFQPPRLLSSKIIWFEFISESSFLFFLKSIAGLVEVRLEPGKKIEHLGVKIELLGQIGLISFCIWANISHHRIFGPEMFYDRGNYYEFCSIVRELSAGGVLTESTVTFSNSLS